VKPIGLLLCLALTACASQQPYATTIGVLQPGATMTVRVGQAPFSAFAPAAGEPRDRFTVAATALKKDAAPAAPKIRPARGGIVVQAADPLRGLLVRVPDDVSLVVDSQRGDVQVTNITGNARIHADHGDVQVNLLGYAEAVAGVGNVSVSMGSTDWPGTLHFGTGKGDVEIWVNENAAFSVYLHTDNGTLFTDFDLRGTSTGRSETISGRVNGGGTHRIDVRVTDGPIRLLRLHPEA
jgi:hypothetical protein